MRSSILLSLLLVASCGVKNSSSYKMGETTRAEVEAIEGQPLSVETYNEENSKVSIYKDDVKFQYKDDILVGRFSNPKGDAKLLLWWQHKFKNCAVIRQELAQPANSHIAPEVQLSCRDQGTAVIYSKGSSVVTRVVEF